MSSILYVIEVLLFYFNLKYYSWLNVNVFICIKLLWSVCKNNFDTAAIVSGIFCNFQLSVDVAETPFDLTLPISICIGTIPIQSIVQQYMPQLQPGTMTNQPQAYGTPVNFDLREYFLWRLCSMTDIVLQDHYVCRH